MRFYEDTGTGIFTLLLLSAFCLDVTFSLAFFGVPDLVKVEAVLPETNLWGELVLVPLNEGKQTLEVKRQRKMKTLRLAGRKIPKVRSPCDGVSSRNLQMGRECFNARDSGNIPSPASLRGFIPDIF